MNYDKDGCPQGGPSCLDCRLPACIYDTEEQQVAAVLEVYRRVPWKTQRELARECGISISTLFRIIKSAAHRDETASGA